MNPDVFAQVEHNSSRFGNSSRFPCQRVENFHGNMSKISMATRHVGCFNALVELRTTISWQRVWFPCFSQHVCVRPQGGLAATHWFVWLLSDISLFALRSNRTMVWFRRRTNTHRTGLVLTTANNFSVLTKRKDFVGASGHRGGSANTSDVPSIRG